MRIRCSFDSGAGVCLWAADEAARLAYGYAIAFADLSLSEDLRRRGEALLALFDTRLCWDNPPTAPSPWSQSISTQPSSSRCSNTFTICGYMSAITWRSLMTSARVECSGAMCSSSIRPARRPRKQRMRMPIAICLWLATTPAATLAQTGCGYVSTSTKPPVSKEIYTRDHPPDRRQGSGWRQTHQAARGRAQDRGAGTDRQRTPRLHQAAQARQQGDQAGPEGAGAGRQGRRQLPGRRATVRGPHRPGQPTDYWEPVVWRKTLDSCG